VDDARLVRLLQAEARLRDDAEGHVGDDGAEALERLRAWGSGTCRRS
jgi:hypothetical protein